MSNEKDVEPLLATVEEAVAVERNFRLGVMYALADLHGVLVAAGVQTRQQAIERLKNRAEELAASSPMPNGANVLDELATILGVGDFLWLDALENASPQGRA